MQRLPLSMTGMSRRRPGVCRDDRDRVPLRRVRDHRLVPGRSGDPRRPRRRRRARRRRRSARCWTSLVDQGHRHLVVDCAAVAFMDASGLGVIAETLATSRGVEPDAHPPRGISPDPADPRHHRAERAHPTRGVRSGGRRPGRGATFRPPTPSPSPASAPISTPISHESGRGPTARRSTPRSASSPCSPARPSRAPTASVSPSSATAVWRRWHRPTTPCCGWTPTSTRPVKARASRRPRRATGSTSSRWPRRTDGRRSCRARSKKASPASCRRHS